MVDELKHECAVAMVVLRKPPSATADYGGTKLSLLLEKQHNRGQDGAGAAILPANPEPGSEPYWIAKSASQTPLTDLLGMIAKREKGQDRVFLGHLRYATFGKNEVAFCHPFVHEASELSHTLLLAGNFNLTNATELFDEYRHHGSFPTSKADGYLICELIAHELGRGERPARPRSRGTRDPTRIIPRIATALSRALANADGAWTLCGMTGDGWAFSTRDPHGIRPGFYYTDDDVAVVASERPAIQAAFDVPPEAVKELPPGAALIVSPEGDVQIVESDKRQAAGDGSSRPCSFERIYFSRANDANIYRERKALGAALVPQVLAAAEAPMERIFFSYIPNSARIAFYGLLEELLSSKRHSPFPRFGEIAVKDAKFRTFIADAAARREFYKHVYDVTYGLVEKDDTLVVLDDSIVRGNTMKNAILPMLDRLGPKRIVIVSSAPPIRYPDCYGIDMSTLGELIAFRALVNLLDGERGTGNGERELRSAKDELPLNPLAPLYARFTEEEHCREIARLLTPPDMKAEVVVVYQTVENLHKSLSPVPRFGDWYFTGDYPTPGGYKVLRKALLNYLDKKNERSY
jgi:amidophosphoribosyltransferase